jgi:hypothetical protein
MDDTNECQTTLSPYQVTAFNIAAELENKIHDDRVASHYGFAGGLVPGTAVFGYMTHQPVALWGRQWLEHGSASCRFHHPVYDGQSAQITARLRNANMDIEVDNQARLCATGSAELAPAESAPAVQAYRLSQPPELRDRPMASPQSLAAGTVLCTRPYALNREQSLQWLADLRETDPVYEKSNLLHPATLLRLCNWTLMHNVVLGPWIHTASHVRNFHAMPVGANLVARGRVLRNWEHQGHTLVELDVLVVIDDAIPAARITHTAIYMPRQVSGSQATAAASISLAPDFPTLS